MENSFYSSFLFSLSQFHSLSNLIEKQKQNKRVLQEAGLLQANLRSNEPQSSHNVHSRREHVP